MKDISKLSDAEILQIAESLKKIRSAAQTLEGTKYSIGVDFCAEFTSIKNQKGKNFPSEEDEAEFITCPITDLLNSESVDETIDTLKFFSK